MSLLAALMLSAAPVLATGDHCNDHNGHSGKVESATGSMTVNGVQIAWGGDPGSVTLTNTNATDATVVWCAKGGTGFNGASKALDEQTTVLAPAAVQTVGPFGTEISYFLLYGVTVTPGEQGEEGEPNTNISKSASDSVVTRGETYSYTLSVSNDGDATATNVHVWDDLDTDLEVVSVTPSQGSCDPVGPSNEVNCWLGDLAAEASATVVIEVDTTEADCQTVRNRAFVQAENEESDSRSERIEVTIECGGTAALNIHKTDEQGNPLAGAVFTVEGLEGPFITNEEGEVCITGLPQESTWLVTETQAPPGYELADPASQMVDVDDDGDCNSPDAVFVNTLAEGEAPDLLLIKEDAEGNPLSGVGFTLAVFPEVVTVDGQITFADIPEGVHTLTETSNPDPDCETGGSLTVTVGADGSITVTDDDEADTLAIVSFDAELNVLTLSNDCEADQAEEEFGRVEIRKSAPADPDADFAFAASWSAAGFMLSDGGSETSGDIAAGTAVTVTEDLTDAQAEAGWSLDGIDCGTASVTIAGSTVTITVVADATITCTFENVLDDGGTQPGGGGGEGTLGGNPPLPNTAMELAGGDSLPALLATLVALAVLGAAGYRAMVEVRARR